MIRWDEPIEAVHEDGIIIPVEGIHNWPNTEWPHAGVADREHIYMRDDGRCSRATWGDMTGWRIRNVAQAPETGSTAPSPSEVGPEVVLTAEQAEMLRKTLAGIGACVGTTIGHHTVFVPARLICEAREALALLPEPVDADEAEVQFILHRWEENELETTEDAVREALKRGRALEKEAGR